MKKVLLIMPNFFEYPAAICEELSCMGYSVDCYDDRPSTKGIVKAIIRVKRDALGAYIRKYFDSIMKAVKQNRYDMVLLISGQSLSFTEDMIKELKSSQTQALFVLYQWDSEENFSYIKRMQKYFDKCYSFDKRDVRNNSKLRFLPLFYTRKYEKIAQQFRQEYKYDFCFVGTAHPKKYKFINEMTQQLEKVYPKQFIYFFFPSKLVYLYRKLFNPEFKNAKLRDFHFEAIKGEKMDELIVNSGCILDSPQEGQMGLTIRVVEALGAKKKIITTNKDVVNYDFYKEENIYIYDGEINFESKFFSSSYKELDIQVYEKYALRNWLKELLCDEEN